MEDEGRLLQEGRPSPEFAEHALGCEACRRWITAESQLRPMLVELASSSRNAAPTAAVRNVLLDELRVLRPVRKSAFPGRLALVAAVLVCVAAVPAVWRFVASRPLPPATVKPFVPPPPPATENTSQSPVETPRLAVRRPERKPKLPASPDGFYPVVMCDSLSCDGPTVEVRVEVPASPLSARGGSRKVVTDLLVGEDGLVRGVRVLQ